MSDGTDSPVNGKIKVLLVDDHPVVRQGLARLINDESDLYVCGESDNTATALELADRLRPDLGIIDISLGGSDGLELIKELRRRLPQMAALVLSMHDESLYAERVIHAGARGYVTKQEAPDKVLTAIRRVLAGEIYLSDRMAATFVRNASGQRHGQSDSPLDRLSDRELQVFRLIGSGMSVREIAEKLFLSVKTIETHREHVKEKLNLKSSSDLLRYAVQYRVDTT